VSLVSKCGRFLLLVVAAFGSQQRSRRPTQFSLPGPQGKSGWADRAGSETHATGLGAHVCCCHLGCRPGRIVFKAVVAQPLCPVDTVAPQLCTGLRACAWRHNVEHACALVSGSLEERTNTESRWLHMLKGGRGLPQQLAKLHVDYGLRMQPGDPRSLVAIQAAQCDLAGLINHCWSLARRCTPGGADDATSPVAAPRNLFML
jgi:hypothetical protein